jgi:protease I
MPEKTDQKKQLGGTRVAILATSGVEQRELTSPREALEHAGAMVQLVSPKPGVIKAWDQHEWGQMYDVDAELKMAHPEDYDALVLPGGVFNPDQLRMDKDAVSFVQAFVDADKPIAAICHGPWTLIETGMVEGRKMTSYPSLRTDLENAGANWVDEEVVVDGQLITSRNPDDLPAFNEAILNALSKAPAVG